MSSAQPARNSASPPPNRDQRRSRAWTTEVDRSDTTTTSASTIRFTRAFYSSRRASSRVRDSAIFAPRCWGYSRRMTKRLQDKTALVTGGSRGIGAAIAEAFAQQGARVIIVARKTEELEATAARINDALGEKRVFAKSAHTGRPEVVGELFAWID